MGRTESIKEVKRSKRGVKIQKFKKDKNRKSKKVKIEKTKNDRSPPKKKQKISHKYKQKINVH